MSSHFRWALVLACALVTGSMDLMYAFWQYSNRGVVPRQILQSIASGWLGPRAYGLGWTSATLGLISHFLILAVAMAVLVEVMRRSERLRGQPLTVGVVFGLVLFLVMNYIVVPLSAARLQALRGQLLLWAVLVHVALIGAPAAWAVSRALQYARSRGASSPVD